MRSGLPLLILSLLLVGGCSVRPVLFPDEDYGPDHPVDVSGVPDAVPRDVPPSRHGNPESYRVLGRTYHVLKTARGFRQRGIASWYGMKFHGHRTSSGEIYDMYAMTAAHKTLPLPTWVRVTNLANGRSVVVKVNDRGPFHEGRIIDLSYAAAAKLRMLGRGTAPVEIVALAPDGRESAPAPHRPASPSRPSSAVKGGRYLQAGAFASLLNARSLQRRLQRRYPYPVRIRQEGGLHKVVVGPLEAAAEVDTVSRTLREWGIAAPHLVQ